MEYWNYIINLLLIEYAANGAIYEESISGKEREREQARERKRARE